MPDNSASNGNGSNGHSLMAASAATDNALAKAEELMRTLAVGSGDDPLGAILLEHLATGGKRLRARLGLTATEALGGNIDDAVGWAAACELLHNATLIHDDIQDGDTQRRGKPAIWVRYGEAQAINAGDLMLMLPYAALADVPQPPDVQANLVAALTRHAVETVRGQAIELALLRGAASGDLRSAYLRGIEGKTSALFQLPVQGGALIAGKSKEDAEQIAGAFERLGMLFKFQDDVLDLYGNKGREAPGADLKEGKVSSLVVEHLRLHPEDSEWLLGVLAASRDETRDEDVEKAIDVFRTGGALGAVVDEMQGIAAQMNGSKPLESFPTLQGVARDFVSLVLAPIQHVIDDVDAKPTAELRA